MSSFMENKIDDEALEAVSGGAEQAGYNVTSIPPKWVRVIAATINCRYTPNGAIAKVYEKGHKLKVDGITDPDGEWYRLVISKPAGGVGYAFIPTGYVEDV